MKGMIFTEFLEMVETQFGLRVKDALLAQMPHGGAYTAVGNYDHREMVTMVLRLADHSQIPVPELLKAFGRHIFGLFVQNYGHFFDGVENAIAFLSGIENYIHVEVRKLYPDAELPTFEYLAAPDGHLVMEYHSPRPLGAFAEGLVRATLDHFGGGYQLKVEDFSKPMLTVVRFSISPPSTAA